MACGAITDTTGSRCGPARRPSVSGRRIASIVVFLGVLTAFEPSARAANAVTVGGPFALTAPDGRTVTDRTYRGRWLLVYFGYRSCPDLCPTTLADVAATLKALGPDAADLQPLFITLDPERDTPELMGDYVQSFDPRIVGLTGPRHEIDAVVQAYGVYSSRHETPSSAPDDLVDHSNYIYLMNPQGAFVRAFDSEWSGERIASTLRAIGVRHRE